ncbi:SbcC/MukB-like Walker B domain-containing protein, partial [Streptomyces albogriseolus]|uniref:SbcC/MukB-like Walker B domain-containing protein n=1 Tax=Streptomyces albogriseolus TaxID=1887 RepID=UPI00369601AE
APGAPRRAPPRRGGGGVRGGGVGPAPPPPPPRSAEELGGLESARRAERRLAELLDARAGLERQERADEEVREDAEAWLADWEATRTALQDRIATAQQAATRAGELAARRDTARHRLEAARTRDRLTRDAETAAEQAGAAREQALAARQHWLDLKEQRLGGIAAELAAGLTDGTPCAVCGATEHPAPARRVAGHVDRETEERALAGYQDAEDRRADAAFRAGFDTPRAAADALLDDDAHRRLQRRLDAWHDEEAAVRAVLAEPETAAAAREPAADLAAAQRAAEDADRAVREAASARDAAARRCAELDRLSARAAASVRRLGPLREEYDRVARMAALTAGTSAENERRMRLESYVLAARLEQVAAAATVRLRRMSSGRYTLVHSDDRTGRGRSGLGLHVVDAWTGRERDTATLSGGETFFASLALALGLADVVTDEAGGVRLDTLFIDEGFGSLDDQTLDEVLDVLDSLRERDRSVGIVSHVPDLRRRIHAQLEVEKDRSGSRLRQRGT